MIGRRSLLRGAAAALVATSVPVAAQTSPPPLRIAYMSFRRGPNEFEQAFVRGLRERGLVDGSNVRIDFRWAAFDGARAQAMAAELVQLRPAVFVIADASGTRGSVRTLDPALPIVLTAMADPIGSGVTRSLARPDDNSTGMSVFGTELSGKRLALLKEALPSLKSAAALYNTRRVEGPPLGVAATVAAGRELGIEVVETPVMLPDGIDDAFAAAARRGVQGVVIVSDTGTITWRESLGERAIAHRLPTVFANRTYLRGGGLMSYGPDLEGAFHRAAYFVERILKGARPADLPIEQPERFQLVLNQRTAKRSGCGFRSRCFSARTMSSSNARDLCHWQYSRCLPRGLGLP
jgi:putative ABC transport system substrate-binding protein